MVFGVVMFGYVIFALAFYHGNNTIVFQALSIILIAVFGYFAISFYNKVRIQISR